MSYLNLIRNYRTLLTSGFLLCFFSGFGQSFFISVFTPDLLQALAISQGQFGMLYAGATLVSALLLPWLGGKLDHIDQVQYARWTCAAFAAACLGMALAYTPLLLGLALFGIRFCGQGLFSHIALTVTARGFIAYRGRALSLVGLGHPASEALLPLCAVLLVNLFGWRVAWLLFAVTLLLMLPALPRLLRGRAEVDGAETGTARNSPAKEQTGNRLPGIPVFLFTWKFWFLTLGMMLPGSILTGLFLYHGVLAELQGWSMAWMAAGFIWFAGGQILFSLYGGSLTDRLGALPVFCFHLLPMTGALGLLAIPALDKWVVPAYLLLAGITNGVSSPLKSALWAELYGSSQLGAIRSWVAAIAVMGTAVSPVLLGLALDAGIEFHALLRAGALVLLCYSIVATCLLRRGRRR